VETGQATQALLTMFSSAASVDHPPPVVVSLQSHATPRAAARERMPPAMRGRGTDFTLAAVERWSSLQATLCSRQCCGGLLMAAPSSPGALPLLPVGARTVDRTSYTLPTACCRHAA